MYTNWDTCISGLAVAILDFRLPFTSDKIPLSTIELAILESMLGAFRISILSRLQAEIQAFSVKQRPSWIFDYRLRRAVLKLVPLSCWTSKIWK